MDIDKIIDTLIGNKDDKKVENFLRFLSDKLWNLYNDYLMDKIKMAENKIRRIPIVDNNKVIGMITLGDLAKNKEINSEGVCATLEDICCTNKNKNAE